MCKGSGVGLFAKPVIASGCYAASSANKPEIHRAGGHADEGRVQSRYGHACAQKAIVARFDEGQWQELGYVLGMHELISERPRLLRSLYWGDPDYRGCVFDVLRKLVGHRLENLGQIEDFVELPEWLKAKEPNYIPTYTVAMNQNRTSR